MSTSFCFLISAHQHPTNVGTLFDKQNWGRDAQVKCSSDTFDPRDTANDLMGYERSHKVNTGSLFDGDS